MTLRRADQSSRVAHARHVAILSMTALLAGSLVSAVGLQAPAEDPCTEITGGVAPFSLSEPGPYDVGRAKFSFQDTSRQNRRVRITVWYPSVRPEDPSERTSPFCANCTPDSSDAPYPLIGPPRVPRRPNYVDATVARAAACC